MELDLLNLLRSNMLKTHRISFDGMFIPIRGSSGSQLLLHSLVLVLIFFWVQIRLQYGHMEQKRKNESEDLESM